MEPSFFESAGCGICARGVSVGYFELTLVVCEQGLSAYIKASSGGVKFMEKS